MGEDKKAPITLDDAQRRVRDFHVKFKFAFDRLPDLLRSKAGIERDRLSTALEYEQKLGAWNKLGMERVDLIVEELGEMIRAWRECDPVGLADGLGDLLYVVLGTCVAAGIDIAPVFEAIQYSNMTKEPDGQFKPAKGAGFKAPLVREALVAQRLITS